MDKKVKLIKIIVAITYIVMIAFTVLSFIKPFNGRDLIEITSSYPNFVTPSFYSYYIWILIYLLLGLFMVYQLDIAGHNINQVKKEVLFNSQIIFLVFCWLNILTIISFQFDYIALASVVILTMLICVSFLCKSLSITELSRQGKWFIKLPFSILYGWLTVSTVRTVVILFVSIRWEGFGIPIPLWAAATLAGMAVYAAIRTQRNKDIVYCLTIIWGYIGILIKHLSETGYDGQYPQLVIADIINIALLAGSAGVLLYKKKSII